MHKNTRKFLDNVQNKVLIKATKRALNRTTPTATKAIIDEFMKERKAKVSVLKKYIIVTKNFKGYSVEQVNVTFGISKKSFGLIEFLKGSKTPRTQKGIAVMARRPLRVEIRPGKVEIKPKAFVAKAINGTYQLFQHKQGKRTKIVRQTEPSLPMLLNKAEVRNNITDTMGKRFVEEMGKAIAWSFRDETDTFKA